MRHGNALPLLVEPIAVDVMDSAGRTREVGAALPPLSTSTDDDAQDEERERRAMGAANLE